MTDHEVDTTITRLQPGTLVDITIKGVRVVGQPSSSVFVKVADEHGDVYAMPPQAAVKRADLSNPIDAGTLQERISNALRAIDGMADEQYLDPGMARAIRQQLDPNPRHWPPQPGDVWDDGMPFGGSLWFARQYTEDGQPYIVMAFVEGGGNFKTPEELLESTPGFHGLTLVYRKRGDQ